MSKWQEQHPALAGTLGGGALAAGAAGGAALTYSLISGLTSGFGLKASAVALEVYAAHLSAAALRLGAAGAVGAVGAEGAAVAGDAAVAGGAAAGAGVVARVVGGALPGAGPVGITAAMIPLLIDAYERGALSPKHTGDYTLGSERGFSSRPTIAPPEGFMRNRDPMRATMENVKPDNPLTARGMLGDITDVFSHEKLAAGNAGSAVGSAFQKGLHDQLEEAVRDAGDVMRKLREVMTQAFSPNPTINSEAAAQSMYGDYGAGVQ